MSKLEQFNFDNAAEMARWSRDEPHTITFEGPQGQLHYEVEVFRSRLMTVYRGAGRVTGIRHIHPMSETAHEAGMDDYMVVAFYVKGENVQIIWQAGRTVALEPGDITIIDAREIYSIAECEGDTDFLHFRMSFETLVNWMPLMKSHILSKVSTAYGWGQVLGNYLSHFDPVALNKLAADPNVLKVVPEHIASMLRNALLEQEEAQLERPRTPYSSRRRKRYRQVMLWLRQNFTDPGLSLETVAAHFHLSSRQLSRIVQIEANVSIPAVLIHMRIERAADMLSLGMYDHLTVAEIATAAGMPNAATFHRNFIRIIGGTPAKFRAEQRAHRSTPQAPRTPDTV